MTRHSFLKITFALCSGLVLSSVAMEQSIKKSMKAIFAEIENNRGKYSEAFKVDLTKLIQATKEGKNATPILSKMLDNVHSYTEVEIRDLLELIRSHQDQLELSLKTLHTVATQCTEKLNQSITTNIPSELNSEFTQKSRSAKKPTAKKKEPEIITIAPIKSMLHALNALNNPQEFDALTKHMAELSELFCIKNIAALSTKQASEFSSTINETKRCLYKNGILGLYGNSEQKLQLEVVDRCTDTLTTVGAQLLKKCNASDKEMETYITNASKEKQAYLYDIKVIWDTQVVNPEDISARKELIKNSLENWKMIIKDKLSSDLEAQRSTAIKKTIEANFDSAKNSLLAEEYENIVLPIYEQKTTESTWAPWLETNKASFAKPGSMAEQTSDQTPTDPDPVNPSRSVLQACKDHWFISSLAISVVATVAYAIWEEWNAAKEEEKKEQEKKKAEAAAKAKQDAQAAAEQKSQQASQAQRNAKSKPAKKA